jgi:uncharacterized protein
MKLTILILLGLLATPSLRADEAAARALAERIVDLVRDEELIQKNDAATLERVRTDLISRGVPAKGAAEVCEVMGDWFKRNFNFQEIRSEVAAIYAEEFTEDELRQMLAFYETPVGRKALRKMAMLGMKITVMAQRHTAERHAAGNSLSAALKPILLKYGITNLPNLSVQRSEASRSAHDTNQTSSASDSRR